jgi:hypothetical protein
LFDYNSYQCSKKRIRVRLNKRKKIDDEIDAKRDILLREYANGELLDMDRAMQCGKVLKAKHLQM